MLDIGNYNAAAMAPGVISPVAGKAAMEWVVRAGELCLDGSVAAMATAPLHKEAASLAGYQDIGHMEVLQRLAEAPKVLTMLMSKGLRVVHLTTHRSLSRACAYVTHDNILTALRLTDGSFKSWGVDAPRIGVAALNPHASDGGLIGDEEQTEITPAIETALAEGINAVGPVPADTVFLQGVRGDYDAILAMYHDQGHIAVKMYGFEESITVNLGLPFVRTSVDHGTAFDIAWQNKADATSMVESIRAAADLATGAGIAEAGGVRTPLRSPFDFPQGERRGDRLKANGREEQEWQCALDSSAAGLWRRPSSAGYLTASLPHRTTSRCPR